MRTVLSHLRRAARNVWTNLQRTGAKRTPQLCDSGGLRASHASLRCHRIRSPLPRLWQPPDTGRTIFPNALPFSPINRIQRLVFSPDAKIPAGDLAARMTMRDKFSLSEYEDMLCCQFKIFRSFKKHVQNSSRSICTSTGTDPDIHSIWYDSWNPGRSWQNLRRRTVFR